MYIPEFGIANMKSWATKWVRMCGEMAHLMLMVLKQREPIEVWPGKV